MRPVVLLDCDGVLADFVGSYLTLVERVLGRRHEREEVREFKVARAIGLSSEEQARVDAVIDREPGFCAQLGVLPGAVDGVRLLEECADVYAVTSPWDGLYWAGERLAWLREHFGFEKERVVQTAAKHLVRGDVLVDDRPEHLDVWQAAHPRGRALLWGASYNRGPSSHVRAASWGDVRRVALQIAGVS